MFILSIFKLRFIHQKLNNLPKLKAVIVSVVLISLFSCTQHHHAVVSVPTSAPKSIPADFLGHWERKDWLDDSLLSDCLLITNDSARFFIVSDGYVELTCTPKYSQDTIFMYMNRNFHSELSDVPMPLFGSLFAKCYLDRGRLRIIYTHETYQEHIKQYELDTILYKYTGVPSGIAVTTQQQKFIGEWYSPLIDSTSRIMDVPNMLNGKVPFAVMINQLDLDCVPKYNEDTLLLYIKFIDCGRLFFPGNYPLPRKKSLFAKCYIKNDWLHIIYTQKLFISKIKDWELPTALYKP